MKKLMMAAAIVCAAAFAQAAAVDWAIKNTADTFKTGNMMVYTFIGDVSDAAILALSSTTESDWSSFLGSSVATISKRGSANGSQKGFGSGDNAMTFVIVDTAVAEGKDWWVMNADDITNYKYEGATPASTFETSLASVAGTGKFSAEQPTPTPEPTSGLLLLLGVAGLALRRKA